MSQRLCSYADFAIGQSASYTKTISKSDIAHFIAITEDTNPLHVDATFAANTFFKDPIAHGMLVGSLFSHIVGMLLPGTGAIYRSQSLTFLKPVRIGDTVCATLTIEAVDAVAETIEMEGQITNQYGDLVIEGGATATLLRKLRSRPK